MGKLKTKLIICAVSGLLIIGGALCPGNPFTVKVEASVLTQEQQVAALQAQQALALQAQQAAAQQAQQALALQAQQAAILQAQQEQAYQAQVLSTLQAQQAAMLQIGQTRGITQEQQENLAYIAQMQQEMTLGVNQLFMEELALIEANGDPAYILQIQQELNELGYPCPVTGILDGQTRIAFYQFYTDYMSMVNGVISLVAAVAV